VESELRRSDATLHFEVTGPKDAPLAILLHGFPDTPHTFRHLTPRLVERGYRVVTPWSRGYAPSSTSSNADYSLSALVGDALALHQELGGDERALLVGHDWGAAIAYGACALAPERWARCVALAVPPLAVFAAALLEFEQARRSWYMWFFNSPFAEAVVAANDFSFLDELWSSWSPGYDATSDLERVKQCFSNPASLNAALAYYRMMFAPATDGGTLAAAQAQRARVPTLYLHGRDDGCVGAEILVGVEDHLAPTSRVSVLAGAGHFVHLEAPEATWREIDGFLA